jgi:photosystem II stability/assembly factor-like uncharacterized protein
VLKTDDGGDTWEPQPLPDDAPVNDLTTIRCASATECLMSTASGDRLLRTTDGGTTIEGFNPSARKVFAASLASPSVAVGVGERGATVRSTNADALEPSFAPVGAESLDGVFSRLRAPTGSIALAPGEEGKLAISTDGARNWTLKHVPTSAALGDAWFTDASHGFVLDVAGRAQRTDDGGDSWALLDTGTSQAPTSIYAPDANTVLLFGPRSVRRSQDGGTSFDPVASKLASKAGVNEYDRTSGGVLFAYGTEGVIVSSDRGATWKAVKGPVKHPRYQRVDFVSESSGFALTTNGRVWRTVNGGRKWKEIGSTGTQRAYDLAFSSATDGYLSIRSFGRSANKDAGWVLHTSDGGVSWRPQLIDNVPLIGRGLATPGQGTAFGLLGASDLVYTNTGGDKGAPTALTLAAKPRSIGRKPKTVKLSGTLSPAAAGASVVISERVGNAGWRVLTTAKASSSGGFTSRVRVRTTTTLVAQWSGDAAHDGDGTKAIVIKRVIPKRH